MSVYRNIYVSHETTENNGSTTILNSYDELEKIEYTNGTETYLDGFRDYHGGVGGAEDPN